MFPNQHTGNQQTNPSQPAHEFLIQNQPSQSISPTLSQRSFSTTLSDNPASPNALPILFSNPLEDFHILAANLIKLTNTPSSKNNIRVQNAINNLYNSSEKVRNLLNDDEKKRLLIKAAPRTYTRRKTAKKGATKPTESIRYAVFPNGNIPGASLDATNPLVNMPGNILGNLTSNVLSPGVINGTMMFPSMSNVGGVASPGSEFNWTFPPNNVSSPTSDISHLFSSPQSLDNFFNDCTIE